MSDRAGSEPLFRTIRRAVKIWKKIRFFSLGLSEEIKLGLVAGVRAFEKVFAMTDRC